MLSKVSILPQNHLLVILHVCQNILPAKRLTPNCGMKKLKVPGARCQRVDQETGGPKLPRTIPAPNANAELVTSMQRKQGNSNSKSRSEQFNPYKEEAASGFPIDPPRQTQAVKEVGNDLMDHNRRRASHSGPLVPGVGWTKTGKKYDDISPFIFSIFYYYYYGLCVCVCFCYIDLYIGIHFMVPLA